tara:strand:+ start:172 stop:402 length:231 start_codon:yes stop_codon:yes gene_type:complete
MSEDHVQNEINKIDEVQIPTNNSEYYTQLRLMVESMESDVLKSERGNKAAATRLRKNLRLLKTTSANFVKFTLGKM